MSSNLTNSILTYTYNFYCKTKKENEKTGKMDNELDAMRESLSRKCLSMEEMQPVNSIRGCVDKIAS